MAVAATSAGEEVPAVTVNNAGKALIVFEDAGQTYTKRTLVLALDATPRVATLTSPLNNTVMFGTTPTYKWMPTDVANASYTLEVRDASNQVVQTQTLLASACSATECSVTPSPALPANQTYTWKVITTTTQGTTATASWNLTINQNPPTLIWPTNNSTVSDTTVTLSWQSLAGATQYVVNVRDQASTDVVNQTVNSVTQCFDGTCSYTTSLSTNSTYTWRVQAKDAAGSSTNWSGFNAFTVQAAASTALNWHYEYDDLNRVTLACSDWDTACKPGAKQFTYTYDGAGNLTRMDRYNQTNGVVESVRYIYNGANQIKCVDANLSTACDGAEFLYVYDPYGNLRFDGATMYTYDAAQRLITTCASTNGTACAGTQTSYQYNGDGDRVSQTVGTTTTTYVIDVATPLTMVVKETTTGQQPIYYLHGLGLIAESQTGITEYFLTDGLGSVRQMATHNGYIKASQSFDPYGNPMAGSSGSSYSWAGEQRDSNGLVFLRARYYNPSTGRFLNTDPSRMEMNPYQYGLSNPILYTDPSGNCAAACIGDVIIIGVVLILIAVAIMASPAYQDAVEDVSADVADGIEELAEGFVETCDDIAEVVQEWLQQQRKPTNPRRWWWPISTPEPQSTATPTATQQPTATPTPTPTPKDIALGLAADLRPFTVALRQQLGTPDVYYWEEWWDPARLISSEENKSGARFNIGFNEATTNAVRIHFNLQDMDPTPIQYAITHGSSDWFGEPWFKGNKQYFTGIELYKIMNNPVLCNKTTFYRYKAGRTLVEVPDEKLEICGAMAPNPFSTPTP